MSDRSSPDALPGRLFCFGLGYSAAALAERLIARGWQVAGTSRSTSGCEALSARGIQAYPFDPDHPLDPAVFTGTTHLLQSIPAEDRGDPVIAAHGADIAKLGLAWIGYLSTTGVYGDHQGGWVDETTPLTPAGPRGQRRVDAERAWLELGERSGQPVQLFRLAGIYGPGRSALDTVLSGRARRIDKPGQVFSRIHVEDIASVLEASIAKPNPGAAYNVCDDDPAAPEQVIAYACELLGVPAPPLIPFEQAELSPMAASFYGENKRVRNDRIKRELGVVLKYPDYRSGLAALLPGLHSRALASERSGFD
jgi:nucleoside-diphosphate-sugar epimerase